MTKKKMLGKLSSFSGIKSKPETEQQPETTQETKPPSSTRQQKPATRSKTIKETSPTSTTEEHSNSTNASTTKQQPTPPVKEKPVTVNIKISRTQHEWLTDTARTVRDNNTEPVPPGDRVYPQHLIGVAIILLQAGNIDWSEVKNVEDLKRLLDI
ncbi:MAG: hypothetical protein HC836_49620 [Richelia sp. RM2_1_2]|nr:hypothetical protein [Richelia sp. SM2_1_7]NJO27284.1 hypothetical protein [Richelia sp. SL_2_1]NJO65853.1 hypothetical protein [Richelia sp. RM2_1_2]